MMKLDFQQGVGSGKDRVELVVTTSDGSTIIFDKHVGDEQGAAIVAERLNADLATSYNNDYVSLREETERLRNAQIKLQIGVPSKTILTELGYPPSSNLG